MCRKKLLYLVALLYRAKSAQRGDRATAAKCCHLFCQCIPMGFQVVPSDLSRGRFSEERGEDADIILLANFALVDERQRALRQLRLTERREGKKEVVIIFSVARAAHS